MPPFAPSPLSIPTLVGRGREQAALRGQLDGALAGHGGLVLVAGEAGIGKTALAEALCRDAEGRGALVLVGHSYDLAETPPYGPWLEVFGRYRAAEGFPALPPGFAERGAVGKVASKALLQEQVRDFLHAVARKQPLLLLLDDLHWADSASLDLLRFVGRSLRAVPLLVVGVYRADEVTRHSPLAPLLPALVREAAPHRLDVLPLRDEDVRGLIADRYRLSDMDAARLGAYVQERAEGNPLFLGELLRRLEAEGALRETDGRWQLGDLTAIRVPALLRQMIAARLERLGEEARALLGIAAAIGQVVPLGLWSAVGQRDEEVLLDIIEQAREARILEETAAGMQVRFVHALIRDAVYEDISPLRRRAWHRQIAEALAAAPDADPDAVAHHFRRAGDPRAAEWLVRAGLRASEVHDNVTAIERYEAALAALTQPHGERGTSGPFTAPEENATLAAYIACALGNERCRSGEYRRGLAEMEAAMRTLEVSPHRARARVEALIGASSFPFDYRGILANWLGPLGYFARARTVAARVLSAGAAEEKTRAALASDGHAYYGQVSAHASLGDPEAAREAYRAGRVALEKASLPAVAAILSMQALVWIALPYFPEDLTERRRLAAEAESFLLQSPPLPRFSPRFGYLPLLFIEGAWEEARALALATLALGYGGIYSAVSARTLVSLALAQGDRDLVSSLVRGGLPRGMHTEPGDAIYPNAVLLQRVAASTSTADGDFTMACGWLEAHDRWQIWSESVLGVAEGHLGWAAYHRAAGDPERARDHAERALAHASDPRQPLALLAARRALGELDTDAGRYDDAAAHLRESLALADACAAPYERALTILALAELHAATDERPAAIALLDEARTVFAALGAVPALVRADTLRARLAPVQQPAAYPDGLTGREVAVLRLVATGKSNREIADALFISERTVNRHITNLYAKIGARGRADATAYVFQHHLLAR